MLGGAAVAILAASGCGDSSSAPVTGASGASGASGSSGSSALTKPAFIKQADAVCAEANSALASLSGGSTTGDESLAASQELDITRSELESLQALTPPKEDRSTLDDFLAALTNEVDALTSLNSAVAGGGDTSSADAELAGARSNAEQAATDYGMKECGNAKSRSSQAGSTAAAPTTTTAAPTTPTTTTTAAPTTPTTPAPAPAPAPPAGGTGGPPSGGTGGGTGGGSGGSGGSGDSGGISP